MLRTRKMSASAKASARQSPLLLATRAKTGGKGIRTPGLLIANETLYQLSYTPIGKLRLARPADFSSNETRFALSGSDRCSHRAMRRPHLSRFRVQTLHRGVATALIRRIIIRATRKNDCSGRFRV